MATLREPSAHGCRVSRDHAWALYQKACWTWCRATGRDFAAARDTLRCLRLQGFTDGQDNWKGG